MNRDAVLANVLSSAGWHSMSGAEKKATTETAIESLFPELERAGREPDQWEATDIGAAMNALLMGWYTLAINYVAHATTPPDLRADAWPRQEHTPSIRSLRDALDYVRGAPARDQS